MGKGACHAPVMTWGPQNPGKAGCLAAAPVSPHPYSEMEAETGEALRTASVAFAVEKEQRDTVSNIVEGIPQHLQFSDLLSISIFTGGQQGCGVRF